LRDFRRILKLIKKSRRVAILSHQNADPDALCSGYALALLLKTINRKTQAHLVAPEGVNKVTRQVLDHIRMKLRQPTNLEAYDLIFTVDTNTLSQLGEYQEHLKKYKGPIITIDHHSPDPTTLRISTYSFSNERATSTAQIVYSFYENLRIPMRRSAALALFLGIAYDTRHFMLATSEVFGIAASLARRGVNALDAMRLLQVPMAESERMARLKASQRLIITRIGEWILASTHVGSHQASVARALVMLGADVAIVAAEKKRQVRMSLRSTQEFYDQTKVHLGRDVAKKVGELIQGAGGGHALAAGICGQVEKEAALERCLNTVREEIVSKK